MINQILCYVSMSFVWIAPLSCLAEGTGPAADSMGELSKVVARVLRDGKDSPMNPGFAKALGLSKDGSPVPMKLLVLPATATTNRFWVATHDTNTVVIGFREGDLATFYLTDVSGQLRKAVINDSRIRVGGLTNIPTDQALKRFEAEKKWWIRKYGANGNSPRSSAP